MTENMAVEIDGLVKRYGSLVAVDHLSIKIPRGSIHGFLGPNGAGKTTTIKVLVGLIRADEGTVKIFGDTIDGDDPATRQKMGYMPELPKFPKYLSPSELLTLYGEMYGLDKQTLKKRIPDLLNLLGLGDRAKDHVGKFSKGMQQKVGIAQALISKPELLVLDEPTIGLDPVGMIEVRDLVHSIAKQGTTVFLSSHLLHEVQQICTDVTIINKGKVLASGSLEEVSHKLGPPSALRVEVADLSDAVFEAVRSLPYVKGVSQEGTSLMVSLGTSADIRKEVSQRIFQSGGTVIGMTSEGGTLEDVFVKLVTRGGEAAGS